MRSPFCLPLLALAAACGGSAAHRSQPPDPGARPQPSPSPVAAPHAPLPVPASMTATAGPSARSSGGCGLARAAFCDTFDRPAGPSGRAGELDPARWSGGRLQPNLPSGGGRAMPIGQATLPGCRRGLPAKVFPDRDTLICEPTPGIASPHLLVAVAAQNYGQNSYRIRQPFDFAGRTGTVVFDADPGLVEGMGPPGWISIEVTEDPVAVPSYALFVNDEGGAKPRNGVELQLRRTLGSDIRMLSLERVHVFKDHAGTPLQEEQGDFIKLKPGHLNRFELRLSQQRVELFASDYSEDGKRFGELKKIGSQAIALGFGRGYVHISMHNHASEKYAKMDAVFSRWDNVGFDGPVVAGFREYDAPDSRKLADNQMDIGYGASADDEPVALTIPGVDVRGARAARLALTAWYLVEDRERARRYTLRYRLNGKAWHDHVLSAGEVASITSESLGAVDHVLAVPVAELVAGDNRVELTTVHAPTHYPPVLANVTLVVAAD